MLVIHTSSRIAKRKKDIAFYKHYSKQQDILFKDKEALKILADLYAKHPQAGYLYMYNQKVKLLEQYGLITKATSQAVVNMNNPHFPYILQPIAEEKLKAMHLQ